mgnify:CR=1 FL=1
MIPRLLRAQRFLLKSPDQIHIQILLQLFKRFLKDLPRYLQILIIQQPPILIHLQNHPILILEHHQFLILDRHPILNPPLHSHPH